MIGLFCFVLAVVCTDNLNVGVAVMKSAQDGARADYTDPLNRARNRPILVQPILVQGSMRSEALVQRDADPPDRSAAARHCD